VGVLGISCGRQISPAEVLTAVKLQWCNDTPGWASLGFDHKILWLGREEQAMAIAPERMGIGIRRHFTTAGSHPYDEVTWERRDARIVDSRDGSVVFEQLGVEVPAFWSQNATNILAQKYFRGPLGSPEREWSLKQVADRIADTIADWGAKDGYFVDDGETEAFRDELKYLIIRQRAAFNSPVWFNIGVPGRRRQASACFILAVEDTMDSILNWYVEEGTIFKGGSGSGINLSKLRSSKEPLTGGGTASGPVSFMRGADASAGTIKSGGTTRRAAKMVVLNADHPNVEDFIWCKAIEERKSRALRDAGFDMDLDGADSHSIQYQNANNSVRVTDEFMQAVIDDEEWHLRAVTTGQIVQTVKARDLFRQIAKAAWECADPGLQFDTTINRWHTAANAGRITASNPCCFVGDTLVETTEGFVRIDDLHKRSTAGVELPLARCLDLGSGLLTERRILNAWVAGRATSLIRVRTSGGTVLTCTPEHRFLLASGAWLEARQLTAGASLVSLDGPAVVVREASELRLDTSVAVYDIEVEGSHNFSVTNESSVVTEAVVVHNSEYVHLDNSACNLASINLLPFLGADGTFDIEAYKQAIEVMFTAQEILVGNAEYPTQKIAETTRRFRQLGLGYANLGALLMALGLAYDSDEGRAMAGAVTALMTGHAYATSARIAKRMGPFAGYHDNREHVLRVLSMHRGEVAQINEELVPTDLLSAAQESWETAVELAQEHGVRNSQATVLAPTGCLVGGSLVPTGRGLIRLHSLADVHGERWQDLGVEVATDQGPRQASRFYVNGLEPVVRVTTARGHTISGTTRHRVKVVEADTGRWVWRYLSDLRPDDIVPLALGSLVGEPQVVPLPALPDAYWTSDHTTSVPRMMTPSLAELVGYFMGDGSLHARGLRFCVTKGDFDVVDHLCRLGKECFGLQAAVAAKRGYTEVRFDSVRLTLWWEACGFAKLDPRGSHVGEGCKAHIPDAVLYSNDRPVYSAFLRGLFEADGTVTTGCPHWMSTSLSLAEDLQRLLLTLGYPTSLSIERKRTGSGTLALAKLRLLNLSYNERWLEEIGFIGSRKQARVLRAADLKQAARMDHIPIPRELIDRLAPANDRLRRVLPLEAGRGTISRRIASELYERTRDPELGHLLSFFYDRVASAELGKEELTYDLSVPDNFTYIANGFVSHNTISFVLDCDTTGIEPDLGLAKTKKLVGGGTMSIVNNTVPRALRRLGYDNSQVEAIVGYIDEHKSLVGAPYLRPEHLPVFACSMGDNPIHYSGHIRMMAAVQPFISGSISKTANMPEGVTVEEVEELYIDAWRLGLKAIAIYRDNCKVAQPLSTAKQQTPAGAPMHGAEAHDAELARKVEELEQALQLQTVVVKQPIRERLPRHRRSATFAFRVADCEGYVTVGEYDDGRPGEVFIKVSKQGSTLAGIMDAFAISVSMGLQHGVPLATYVTKFTSMRFEPAGMTDDPDLRIATSLVDYIFRRLAVDHLSREEREELGILTTGERRQPTLPGIEELATPSTRIVQPPVVSGLAGAPGSVLPTTAFVPRDAPMCYVCGNSMQRAGSCYVCTSCGATSGCS